MLIGAAAAGIVLLSRRLRADQMVVAIAGGVACLVLIANLIVVPAIAEATSLRDFTRAAMRTIGSEPAAYFGGLDYEVAYYSGRTIPVLGPNDPATARFLFCWQSVYTLLPPKMRARYTMVMSSNPTDLDGSGIMLLLRREPAPGTKSARPL